MLHIAEVVSLNEKKSWKKILTLAFGLLTVSGGTSFLNSVVLKTLATMLDGSDTSQFVAMISDGLPGLLYIVSIVSLLASIITFFYPILQPYFDKKYGEHMSNTIFSSKHHVDLMDRMKKEELYTVELKIIVEDLKKRVEHAEEQQQLLKEQIEEYEIVAKQARDIALQIAPSPETARKIIDSLLETSNILKILKEQMDKIEQKL